MSAKKKRIKCRHNNEKAGKRSADEILIEDSHSHARKKTHEEVIKPHTISNLKDGECIVILDWKMKFLAAKHREAMQEFFGKAGITWHGT